MTILAARWRMGDCAAIDSTTGKASQVPLTAHGGAASYCLLFCALSPLPSGPKRFRLMDLGPGPRIAAATSQSTGLVQGLGDGLVRSFRQELKEFKRVYREQQRATAAALLVGFNQGATALRT